MAKINIEVDVEKSTVSAKVDGKSVKNLRDVFISTSDGFMGFAVELTSVENKDGLKTVTRVVANEKGELVDDPKAVSKDILENFRHQL